MLRNLRFRPLDEQRFQLYFCFRFRSDIVEARKELKGFLNNQVSQGSFLRNERLPILPSMFESIRMRIILGA